MRRLCAALIAVISIASGAGPAAAAVHTTLTATAAEELVIAQPKVAKWLSRYPSSSWVATATFDRRDRHWNVSVLTPKAGKIAVAKVDDDSGHVIEAWVGPQVGWPLARGKGIGGAINRPLIWLLFSALFLCGLANLKRPLSIRNLDLVGMLSFSVSVLFLNDGRVFAADVAAAASLVYLIARCMWIGISNRAAPAGSGVPVWLLVAGLVFLIGLRAGLTAENSHVLDVGYAGVIGADRLVHGQTPYGTFPRRDTGTPCGPANEDGDIADWVQANGRCETANPLGDTYGPVNYHSYVPGLWLFGWSGKWDSLPAVRFTTILFDLLAMLGLAATGLRYGGRPLAVTMAFAWAANPLTQYVSSSNTNDAIMAAFLVWGFWAASSAAARGAFAALASWTKLAALIVVPLWLTYRRAAGRPGMPAFAAAFTGVTLLSFWVLFVGGDPVHNLRVFYERTFQIQAERSSPFSLWDWGQYHATGLPDLKWLQRILQVALVIAAIAVAIWPKTKSPLQLAAFTAALLMAFELVLTHWAALYVAWFTPFLALALLTGAALHDDRTIAEPAIERPAGAPAGAPA